jgi:hypothetical protein
MPAWLSRLTAPSRTRFTTLVVQALRATGAPEPVRPLEGQFAVAVGPGEDRRFYLDNAYRDYCTARPWHRRRVIAAYFDYAALGAAVPERYEDARPDLLPKVRERFFHECLRLHARAQGSDWTAPPSRNFGDEFVVELVWDQPLTMAVITDDVLRRWGVSFEEALEQARDNLWALSKGRFQTPVPGVHVSAWHDTHDASRAFLHDLVWHLDVAGDPVVFLPNRNVLVVTGAEDGAGLIGAAGYAEQMLDDTRPMSGQPLRLEGREWRPFEPPPGHPARTSVHNLVLLSRARHYAEQKDLLGRVEAATGGDAVHASCSLMQGEDGSRWTYTVWGRGVVGTLPECEWVAFVEAGTSKPRALGRAPWAKVREVMGPALTPYDVYPPRYTVDRFPNAQELARLDLQPL